MDKAAFPNFVIEIERRIEYSSSSIFADNRAASCLSLFAIRTAW
jgi:hypothetical protein